MLVIDAPTCRILQEILHDESRTLLLYACESYPQFTAADRAELARLQQCADQEMSAARTAVSWLTRHGGRLLPMDPYPSWYTQINFISLDHLLPQLVKEHRAAIARLAADLEKLTASAPKALVEAILAQKKKTLAVLLREETPALAGAGH
jgi:hypothetical protein